MTEDEAKTKWCPQTRYVSGGHGRTPVIAGIVATNFTSGPDGYWRAPCVASACMMWRETKPREWIKGAGRRKGAWSPADGFCGLAGRPA